MFSELPIAVILYQADGSIYDCNEAACKIFGYTRSEMKSRKHANLLPENISKRMPAKLALEIPTNNEFLWVIRRQKDGTIFECEHNSKIIKLEGIEYCLSCYRRTESNRMEHLNDTGNIGINLPESSSNTAIFTWQEIDGELRMTGYNTAMEEFTQGTVKEFVGSTPHELYEHRGRTDLIDSIYDVYQSKGMLHKETYCDFLITDNYRFVDIVSFFVQPNLLVQFIEDVTDSHHALLALQESEERFKALYIASPIPVITWKYQGGKFILIGYNNAMDSFTQDRIMDFVGTSTDAFFCNTPELRQDIKYCYENKTVVKREVAMTFLTNNDRNYLEITHAYVPGNLVISHINDITEQKWAEAELLRSQQELSNLYKKHLNSLERERERISQELHDGIGQYLSTIKFSTENMLLSNDFSSSKNINEQLRANIALLKEAITDTSRIAMDLRPSILDDLGVVATINWFLREFGKVYKDILIEKYVMLEESEIPQQIKIVIYRVLQEAMNNIARHSKADKVIIKMSKEGGGLVFIIEDNGIGFNISEIQKSTGGLGIAGMRERVAFSKGYFSIKNIKQGGTAICVQWPLAGYQPMIHSVGDH